MYLAANEPSHLHDLPVLIVHFLFGQTDLYVLLQVWLYPGVGQTLLHPVGLLTVGGGGPIPEIAKLVVKLRMTSTATLRIGLNTLLI